MKAGRELDALVAIALKWEPVEYDWRFIATHPDSIGHYRLPFFSTEIGAAWAALDKLDLSWWPEVGRMDVGTWYCEICRGGPRPIDVGPPFRVEADTAPLAICLAALKAVGVEVPA